MTDPTPISASEDTLSDKMHLMQMFMFNASTHTLNAWMDENDGQVGGLTSFAYWKDIARTLERGCFDGVFFADVAVVHDVYAGSANTCMEYGVSWPSQDPMPLVAVMADATKHLGFGVTLSTSATPPYLAVRRLSTLDNLSGGRVGWNIVTGVSPAEYRANGLDHMPHDERYDYAEEYMEVCYKLWQAVPSEAILIDKQTGHFADASKITTVIHQGKYLRSHAAPPTFPSPQGHPVLFQAGSSGRGMQFAAKHAEAVFSIQPHQPAMQRFMGQVCEAAEREGYPRPKVLFGVQPIIGSTEEEAKRKAQQMLERIPVEAVLARLSGIFGEDLSVFDPDRPIEEIKTQASRGLVAAMSAMEDGKPATLREVASRWALSVGIPQIIGTPEQIADRMETLWRETGCYGFNISPTAAPTCVTDFVDTIVPLFQKRGIFRTDYSGSTFRENLMAN